MITAVPIPISTHELKSQATRLKSVDDSAPFAVTRRGEGENESFVQKLTLTIICASNLDTMQPRLRILLCFEYGR